VLAVAYIVLKAVIAIVLWGGAAIGFWLGPLRWYERLFAFVSACFLVAALPATDEIGFVMTAMLVIWHVMRERRRRRAAGAPQG
jgi:TRAP-type uncharacterized transport system fused permease subunit